MFRLAFYPVGDSYLLVLVAALVLLGLLFVGPQGGKTTFRRRMALLGLRLAIVAMLLLAILRPTLVYTQTKKQSATVVLLADQTRSMKVPDGMGGKTRWETLRESVADAQPALEKMAEDFELRAFGFDAQTHPLKVEGGSVSLPEKAEGTQSAIGAALEDILRLEAGKRLLGVVLLTDGAQRAYAPRDIAPHAAAAQLSRLGFPLFAVPFGQSRGLGQAQDIAVTDLQVNQSVFVKNELAIGAQVRVDGFVGREIPLRVLFETSPGKMEVVAAETIKTTADGQIVPIKLSYAPQQSGEFKLTFEAAPQSGELVTTNNQMSTFVNVLKGGLRVLYLEGALRPETTFLIRSLDASQDIKVDYVRLNPQHPESRPADLADRFLPGKYEVYILGDLDAAVFRAGELASLAKAVDQGAGLIMLGGLHSFGPGGYANTPLQAVLPVEMHANQRQRFGDPPRADMHLPGPLQMRPTPQGLAHYAMVLADNRPENESAWAKLPPFRGGVNRFDSVSPLAIVLAVTGRDQPVLVAQPVGNGRAMAFAASETWRWWLHGYESAHKRFWRQVVLWLARKDQSSEGNVWVRLAKRRFAPAERVECSVGAQSPTGEPLTDVAFEASIVSPKGQRRTLALVRQGEQTIGSFHENQAPGDYTIEVTATQNGVTLGNARARFVVFQQDLELDNAAADIASLQSLAAMTGGEVVPPEQLPDLIERLSQKTDSLEIEQETKRSFWDTWPFFLVFVGLLTVEWYLRKRWGLV